MARSASDLDVIRKVLAGKSPGSKQGKGDIKWYGFPKTTEEVRLRILPPMEGKEFPFKMLLRHYQVPDMENNPICPVTFGQECEICNVIKEFEGRIDCSEWSAQVQCYANVQVKKDPTQAGFNTKEVYVLRSSRGMLKWFSDLWDDEEGKSICDAYEGRDIIVKRKKYNGALEIRPAFSASPIGDTQEEIESILSKRVDLDKIWGEPDDNDRAEIIKGATALKEVIENKILQMAGDEHVPAEDPDVPDETMPEAESPAEGEETPDAEEEILAEEPAEPETSPAKVVKTAAVAKSTAGKPATATKQATSTASKPATATKLAVTPAKVVPKAAAPSAGKPHVRKPSVVAAPAKPASKAKVTKPNDAPECFSNNGVYDENAEKCLECPHEFNCREAIQGAGA